MSKYKNGNNPQNAGTQANSTAHKEPYRAYIPSPVGVQVAQNEDLTGVNLAMHRADSAEQQALETLKMK